jgi:hypothetical protein
MNVLRLQNICVASITALAVLVLFVNTSHAQTANFAHDIRPILASKCFGCHGPDEAHREAELRLDIRSGIFGESESIGVIVEPGSLDESELYYRITTADTEDAMPPADEGERLSPSEIEVIRQWIEEGADWSDHWSFEKPERSELPVVQDSSWPVNGIDWFVLAQLEEKGLAPSPEADRSTLIRRVSLDLIGLPPTWEEVDGFLKDESPDAYEKMVDRILASPRYGERWARVWLDLARYSDTKGYEKDLARTIWPYRDYVINAFNQDMPYDQFTTEQLAGDLLPNATMDKKIATAFHRNTMTNDEGGTDNEEFRVYAVRDRIDTTMQVWMGLTMGCAKCHSHKYDPVSINEYYSMFAFFNQTADADLFSDAPVMAVPTPEQTEEIKRLRDHISAFDDVLDALAGSEEIQNETVAWEEQFHQNAPTEESDESKVPDEIVKILRAKKRSRTGDDDDALRTYVARTTAELTIPVRGRIDQLRKDIDAVPVPKIPVFRELSPDKQRETHVQLRGSFLSLGEKVTPNTPKHFHPMGEDAPRNRLGVAQWLMSPDNPLTARVGVNRHWAQFFGRGIVETEEDFGSQGMMPSHPELLDWLALEFADSGWSFKELCKTIVMSATYRQSSVVTSDLLTHDPDNRYFARGPRFRLDAETVRDNALAVAGLLSEKMYGPSVMPPQPDGVWASTYNQTEWITSEGEDRYRRGLYTYHKRTSPYPSMLTFDAPTREWCAVRRILTNTPLQALITLNDPVYVEAAQAFARQVLTSGGETIEDRIRFAYRSAASRSPKSFEFKQVGDLFKRRLSFYKNNLNEALVMSTNPLGPLPADMDAAEAAAWTAVCNVLLNLDEVLTKG